MVVRKKFTYLRVQIHAIKTVTGMMREDPIRWIISPIIYVDMMIHAHKYYHDQKFKMRLIEGMVRSAGGIVK